ncbi:hypothetical protein [Pontiella agarivorans]|uniref:VWFA domain-containing protein n=1 Tax=Pontiella agarivorans TaxID=3038953 RepID=A0ABU5MSB1_9BACT|nr:hypothetical protein [Pontiella agarivorans]MDZ8117079.1 hypothetical protein [Pontiella agarivorans]
MFKSSKKGFFAKHAKSSAAMISLGIHAVLIVVALSFVAVTVIQKDEQKFEAKPVQRPKMPLKKLQVPVNIKKKKIQKPKLRKRIVVKPKLASVPEIRMPEIAGVKGGLGNAVGNGLGGTGSIGFSMPEFELFGVKGRGEKVFIVLDASGHMMTDGIGGIPAYTIIKNELVRILEELNSAVIFNIAVYGGGDYMLFPDMVPATPGNVEKVKEWLAPLNAVSKNMGDRDYGPKTLASRENSIRIDTKVDPLQSGVGEWVRPTMQGMQQQADVFFVLSCRWGKLRYKTADAGAWDENKQARWKKAVTKAKALHKKENNVRRKKGQPPRVVTGGDRGLVKAYLPGEDLSPKNTYQDYTPREIVEALSNVWKEQRSKSQLLTRRLGNMKKSDFSVNVIHFVAENSDDGKEERFAKVASLTRGDYREIKGLAAIQSYVSTEPEL